MFAAGEMLAQWTLMFEQSSKEKCVYFPQTGLCLLFVFVFSLKQIGLGKLNVNLLSGFTLFIPWGLCAYFPSFLTFEASMSTHMKERSGQTYPCVIAMKIIYENEIQKLVIKIDFYIVIFFMWLIIFNLWTEVIQKRKMYRKIK